MTHFEEFAKEMNVKIETDENGLYTGMCKALANICNDIILSDNENIRNAPWEIQKGLVKDEFYKIFPYMKPEPKRVKYNSRTFEFRICDTKNISEEDLQNMTDKIGYMQYEKTESWLVVPGIGYGWEI